MKKMIPANKLDTPHLGMDGDRPPYNAGATSVLVIFMLMVLASLGTFAITASNVGYKLSMRAFDWNAMYYSLDARAEEYLCELDAMLADAEDLALDYTLAIGSAPSQDPDDLPPGLPAELNVLTESLRAELDEEGATGQARADAIGSILKMAYMYYTASVLDWLDITYPNAILTKEGAGPVADLIRTQIQIKSEAPDFSNCYLDVSALVWTPEYLIELLEDDLSIVRADAGPRYYIEEWREYQEDPAESTGSGLWKGFS